MKPSKAKTPALAATPILSTAASSASRKNNGAATAAAAAADQLSSSAADSSNEARLHDVEEWMRSSKWRLAKIVEGLRLFEQVPQSKASNNAVKPPCYRVDIPINASATSVFQSIMYLPSACLTGILKSMRVLQTIDNSTDIIHIKMQPVYTFPTWTSARDLCLVRYWRSNSDGSYLVCLDSTFHHECPLEAGHVRAGLHAAYLICPPKEGEYDDEPSECLLTFIAELDPRGWICRLLQYQHTILEHLMTHVFDVRDHLDSDRFVQAHFDPIVGRPQSRTAPAGAREGDGKGGAPAPVSLATDPALAPDTWGESEGSTFKVRGKTYNSDKLKVSSEKNLFKLVAVDLFEVADTTHNIASNPKNRVFQALQRGDSTWVFVMNIMVPGPPNLSFVAYWDADRALIQADTPFGRVARPFFDGNDDEYRNNRFKLIPKVIDGNVIIRMAVKDTPTLLGNKLKQYYYKGDNYFELDVDVGSSQIARNVCGLAISYAKNIVVDMGLCLQGNDEAELPEVMMGSVTCIKVDTTKAVKL